jgi:hypothetical protein
MTGSSSIQPEGSKRFQFWLLEFTLHACDSKRHMLKITPCFGYRYMIHSIGLFRAAAFLLLTAIEEDKEYVIEIRSSSR